MHGREGDGRKRSWHMWSVSTRGTTTKSVASNSTASTVNFFYKDGRKISVGDCALFKPPQDSPPFIGIIHRLPFNRENNPQLGVNWLYRPAELKLGKGILLDAAPNEVFYSFHKDEIPAASLLHPCKVAFLSKGTELPSGISSFVCRQVYDIANKCLWWLTDQDYINERQEEVNQLLYKTQTEMHATLQSGGHSPKPINAPTLTSQLKPASDDVHCTTSFPPQVKGKKRERAEQSSEPIKRDRFSKTDGDSGQFKQESILKSEIAKITEKGGLVDSEGVEKLVQLMQLDKSEKKMELVSRSMLAAVIAATDKLDCLSWFVHFRGLPVLDEWLQDIHKGKIGDGCSHKDSDKSVEEFLLVLLRALDKLPVNLDALKMCNIGKSVNHLRTYKNLEIQKKARSLVDTWKKRVEMDLNIIDAKSGSTQAVTWPSRSRIPEVSQGGNRHPTGSSEVALKNSVTQQSLSKTASVKIVPGEIKSASSSPGPTKSALSPASVKDGQPRNAAGGASDLPTTREEKSSSSSQSQNNSQSYSSDHAKTIIFSGKEDARSSTAGSMSVNKLSGGGSRHRKSNNGFSGSAGSVVQREAGSSRSSSLHKNSALDKTSQSGLTSEKALDGPYVEGSNQKLIVKIPNRGRSPAQSASGGSFEDPYIMNSRASSPVLSDKHEQFDRNSKEKSDAYRANITSDVKTESWQSNDFKDALTGSDEGDGSPATVPDEEQCVAAENTRKLVASKIASSSSGSELKSGKLHESSFSSINALIESCVKCCEADTSMSLGDDVGMDLLASVAAGEMSKSDIVSPTYSPLKKTPIAEDLSINDDAKEKLSCAFDSAHDQIITEKQGVVVGASCFEDGSLNLSKNASANISEDKKVNSSFSKELPAREHDEHSNFPTVDVKPTTGPCLENHENSVEMKDDAHVTIPSGGITLKVTNVEGSMQLREISTIVTCMSDDGAADEGSSFLLTNDKVLSSLEPDAPAIQGSSTLSSIDVDAVNNNNTDEKWNSGVRVEQKPSAVMMLIGGAESTDKELYSGSATGIDATPESVNEYKTGKTNDLNTVSDVNLSGKEKNDETSYAAGSENQVLAGLGSTVVDRKNECMEASVETKGVPGHDSGVVPHKESPALSSQGTAQLVRSQGSKYTGAEADETEECTSTMGDVSSFPAAGATVTHTKPKFDLNEGFVADEGKYGDSINFAIPGCSAPVNLINPVPLSVSSASSTLPSSITVTAAAKGPFVPPEDLLRSKGELGWKGSAATSAFRRAEPRKVQEMTLGTTNITLSDATVSKHGRHPLDIDLNVPDERILEEAKDIASRSTQEGGSTSDRLNNGESAQNDLACSVPLCGSGGLGLDLNQTDETSDMGQYTTNNSRKLEVPHFHVKPSSSADFPNCEVRRDFDLNNGPLPDEGSAGPSSVNQHGRNSMQSQPPISSLRMNHTEMGNFSSWFSHGNTYSDVTTPSILPDRVDQHFPTITTGGPPRILGPPIGGNPFTSDVYRGSVLSSSPAVPFASSPFQYPVFPFGTSFPPPSVTLSGGSTTYVDSSSGGRLCFPVSNSQLLGPAGSVSSQYPRPYVVSVPEGSHNVGGENNRKWGRQCLDLNAGPGSLDLEGREEILPLAPGQLPVASSQALAEEQARIYHMAGGVLKRKEPDAGWNAESFRFKQASWQ